MVRFRGTFLLSLLLTRLLERTSADFVATYSVIFADEMDRGDDNIRLVPSRRPSFTSNYSDTCADNVERLSTDVTQRVAWLGVLEFDSET